MPTEIKYFKNKLFITDESGHNLFSHLYIIDITSIENYLLSEISINKGVSRIPVGKTPAGLSINQSKNYAYIANRYSNYVSVIYDRK